MKQLNIVGKNFNNKVNNTRLACRAIIVVDHKVLITYFNKTDVYMLPGGGLEENETFKQCCYREVEEETGKICEVDDCILLINEYYEDWRYVSLFYPCKIVKEGKKKPTEEEVKADIENKWIDIDEMLEIFSKYQEYENIFEEKRGIYLREYLALKTYKEEIYEKVI